MEERAVQQQEKIEGSWEGGQDGGKAAWKGDRSLSSLLKHSCLLCWSSPRDTDVVETDERELENAVTVENVELQEQQTDRNELEETLLKLETHKEALVQQIKGTRQLCYEESQQILSLQAEEVQKESQVEEYERELARVRWRLKRLRDEVKHAKRKVEEAGERDTPLQDSIRQSYDEILQEEHTLCSLSGSAVTPESLLEESTSPADTTEDDPLPMRPWGRSQSLPAYADLIMRASGSSFCNNLADTREEVDDSGTSSPKVSAIEPRTWCNGSESQKSVNAAGFIFNQSDTARRGAAIRPSLNMSSLFWDTSQMDRSDIEDNVEEVEIIDEGGKELAVEPTRLSQLDFYQADPFAHCQSDRTYRCVRNALLA
ncbi:Epidermal growth factor receptor substrate 15 [Liparis tanakae]|uniref:Epidermal growth factor receptor substrate 15 n=1 Tax=Liparis tanakae TaxID=230148 RepID=A0A4Z2F5A2_9TELE|nr:Epidermal growth factor receptor substrate 15 [Liparis tanakae]